MPQPAEIESYVLQAEENTLPEQPDVAQNEDNRAELVVEFKRQVVLAAVHSSDEPTLHFPLVIKRRGRPRGCDTTVLGIKKRKEKFVGFLSLSIRQKQEVMLGWLYGSDAVTHNIGSGYQTVAPEIIEIPQHFRDGNVLSSLSLLQNFVDTEYIKKKAHEEETQP